MNLHPKNGLLFSYVGKESRRITEEIISVERSSNELFFWCFDGEKRDMRLLVIGIDALPYPFIREKPKVMPFLSSLGAREFICDVRPIHSGPAWTTIFAGETKGITDFIMGKERERMIREYNWIWSLEKKKAIALGIPAALPPIYYPPEYRMKDSLRHSLSVTIEEMIDSNSSMAELVRSIDPGIVRELDLLITVFPSPDRAGHLLWGKREYENVLIHLDWSIYRMLRRVAPERFIILSDHGMTGVEESMKNGWDLHAGDGRRGGHSPFGVITGNLENLPGKVSGFYEFVSELLNE